MPLPHAWHKNQRTKAPERIDSIKDLFWRLCDYRRPYRGALSPIFQPCGQGSFLEAVQLKMPRLVAGIHFLPTRTDDTMPLADLINIANRFRSRNPFAKISVTFVVLPVALNTLAFPWEHTSLRASINIGDFAPHKFLDVKPHSAIRQKIFFDSIAGLPVH